MRYVPPAAMLACCLGCSPSHGPAAQHPERTLDSTEAARAAIAAVRDATRDSYPLVITSFRRDTAGFEIRVSPQLPPGTMAFGGGGRVWLDSNGRVVRAELYQ